METYLQREILNRLMFDRVHFNYVFVSYFLVQCIEKFFRSIGLITTFYNTLLQEGRLTH